MKASQAKRAAQKLKLRSDEEVVKVAIKTDLLEQKFSKPHYRKLLLGTGDKQLRVQSDEENVLGETIMQIRQDIS